MTNIICVDKIITKTLDIDFFRVSRHFSIDLIFQQLFQFIYSRHTIPFY